MEDDRDDFKELNENLRAVGREIRDAKKNKKKFKDREINDDTEIILEEAEDTLIDDEDKFEADLEEEEKLCLENQNKVTFGSICLWISDKASEFIVESELFVHKKSENENETENTKSKLNLTTKMNLADARTLFW